jgi:hypothetical protein
MQSARCTTHTRCANIPKFGGQAVAPPCAILVECLQAFSSHPQPRHCWKWLQIVSRLLEQATPQLHTWTAAGSHTQPVMCLITAPKPQLTCMYQCTIMHVYTRTTDTTLLYQESPMLRLIGCCVFKQQTAKTNRQTIVGYFEAYTCNLMFINCSVTLATA